MRSAKSPLRNELARRNRRQVYARRMARVPVEVDYASDSLSHPVLDESDLLIVISHRAKLPTLLPQWPSQTSGCKVMAICNVQGSMITREAERTILSRRRTGNQRRFDQSVHVANHRALYLCALSRRAARKIKRRTGQKTRSGINRIAAENRRNSWLCRHD